MRKALSSLFVIFLMQHYEYDAKVRDTLLKIYIGQYIRESGVLQFEFKEERDQIKKLLQEVLITENRWYSLALYITTEKGTIVAKEILKERIRENDKQLQIMLEQIPEKVLGFFIKRFVSNNLSFAAEGPISITPYDEKWENHVLADGRVWVLWRKFFDSLVSVGLCVKAHSYVSTRGGETRELNYVLSPEIKEYLLSKYSHLTDFSKEEENTLKTFSALLSNWYLFLPSNPDVNRSREKLYELLRHHLVSEELIAKIINDMSKYKITSEYRGLLSEGKPFDIFDENRYLIYLEENLIKQAIYTLLTEIVVVKIVRRRLTGFFDEAKEKLDSARNLLNSEQYADSLERLQKAIELTNKGILNLFKIEYPRKHEVSERLFDVCKKLENLSWNSEKEEFKKCLAKIAILSKILSEIRSAFDYPQFGVTPSEAFSYPLNGMARELLSEFEILYSQIRSILENPRLNLPS